MKKILFYIDSLRRSGAQRVMANLADHFAQTGYEVVLVNDFPPLEPQYEVCEAVRRRYLRQDNSGNALVKNLARIWNLRKLVKEEQPDLILSFLGRPNLRMLVATLGLKVKKVVSVRNDPNREYAPGGVKKLLARLLFGFADGCVFQTEDAAAYFPQKVRSKATVIFNPVGQKFYERQRSGEVKDIVTLGRLEPQKNHKLLIDAFGKIAAEFPGENLIIYGDGPLRREITQQIADLGLQQRVLLPGNTSDVDGVLAGAKLFALPSDYEGMPNALMEAMAMGVPCISTDCPCGGPRSLITAPEQGLLVPCGDEAALCRAMQRVLQDEMLQNTMSLAAGQRAREFCPQVIYRQWEDYLKTVAG